MSKKHNPIKEKSFAFALRIIKLNQYLVSKKKEYTISKQVLRSGIAIGALVEEACQGESKPDFIHKMSIANKEAFETKYWLMLLKGSGILSDKEAESMLKDCREVITILVSILKTSKNKYKRKKRK